MTTHPHHRTYLVPAQVGKAHDRGNKRALSRGDQQGPGPGPGPGQAILLMGRQQCAAVPACRRWTGTQPPLPTQGMRELCWQRPMASYAARCASTPHTSAARLTGPDEQRRAPDNQAHRDARQRHHKRPQRPGQPHLARPEGGRAGARQEGSHWRAPAPQSLGQHRVGPFTPGTRPANEPRADCTLGRRPCARAATSRVPVHLQAIASPPKVWHTIWLAPGAAFSGPVLPAACQAAAGGPAGSGCCSPKHPCWSEWAVADWAPGRHRPQQQPHPLENATAASSRVAPHWWQLLLFCVGTWCLPSGWSGALADGFGAAVAGAGGGAGRAPASACDGCCLSCQAIGAPA